MNKSTGFLLLGLLFAVAGAGALWYRGELSTSIKGKDYEFAIKDTAQIGKIFLANRNGGTITLERKNSSYWLLNGKYRARQSGIDNLLEVFWGMQLKFRLPRNTIKNVVEGIATTGVKVEVFSTSGKLLKAYYVGGVTLGEDATFLMMEGSNEPYCIFEPRRGNIRVSYLTKEVEWRDKAIFAEDPATYKSAWLLFGEQPSKSFRLTKSGANYAVQPLLEGYPAVQSPYRNGSAETWLAAMPLLVAEDFQNESIYRDSISTLPPFCTFGVVRANGQADTIKIWPIHTRNGDGDLLKDDKGQIYVERYFANNNHGDFYVIQHRLALQLLRPIGFFFSGN